MSLLSGHSTASQQMFNRPGFARRTFMAAVTDVTASATRTFAFNLGLTGPKWLVFGHGIQMGGPNFPGDALAMRIGAGVGDPLFKQGEPIAGTNRGLVIWEGYTELGGTQTVTVTYGIAPTIGTVLMGYKLTDLISFLPVTKVESKLANNGTNSVLIDIPANSVLLGFNNAFDATPGTVTWNTPGEDADAIVSSSHQYSCYSVEIPGPGEDDRLVRSVATQVHDENNLIAVTYR